MVCINSKILGHTPVTFLIYFLVFKNQIHFFQGDSNEVIGSILSFETGIDLVIEQMLLACLINFFHWQVKDAYIHPIILREILRKYTFLMT